MESFWDPLLLRDIHERFLREVARVAKNRLLWLIDSKSEHWPVFIKLGLALDYTILPKERPSLVESSKEAIEALISLRDADALFSLKSAVELYEVVLERYEATEEEREADMVGFRQTAEEQKEPKVDDFGDRVIHRLLEEEGR